MTIAGTSLGNRILKVNHAGEHGAVGIYTGQILMARLTAPHLVDALDGFRAHERRHRQLFDVELQRRHGPRCRSYTLCGLGGLALGLLSGLLGAKAIAVTTVAVERVVLRHLAHQLEALSDMDPAATATISAIVEEERQHHDDAAAHLAAPTALTRRLSRCVSASTEGVIRLGMVL